MKVQDRENVWLGEVEQRQSRYETGVGGTEVGCNCESGVE